MDRGKLPHGVDLYLEGGVWKLRMDLDSINADGLEEHAWRDPACIGPATGPERLTRKEVQRVAWERFLSTINSATMAEKRSMTIAEFVENKFAPEHVATKSTAGRTHYRAILKHVLGPEVVQHIFGNGTDGSRSKLRAIPDWPYLGALPLSEVRPEDIEKLMLAAVQRGYSTQTVTHMRNVVSAIYSYAAKAHYFHGENPASQVSLPGMNRKEPHALTLNQTKSVLARMRYPEREMTLTAILTSMNVAEICGLQWSNVNLSSTSIESGGEIIPPMSISIRNQWYRGELSGVKRTRARDFSVPSALLPVLTKLSQRSRFTGPKDFVFVSQAGTPINETNVASRRLKSIGGELQMPWLSWQVFRRTHKSLVYNFGTDYHREVAAVVGE